MSLVIQLLASTLGTLVLFAGSFGGGRAARSALCAGKPRAAKRWCWLAFVCSSLLALITILLTFYNPNFAGVVFSVVWCFVVRRDYRNLMKFYPRS